ncbi:precorrin-6A/cobalt-precorrin-6A reductase [Marivita sp. S0852]|uniref:precorrin-6A/cobalt-precorrin-6A reductase n=1 Tax=Marivita sp. S0852 TaxID=3373893 RepID=UPI00398205A8
MKISTDIKSTCAGQIAILGGSAEARDLVQRLGASARLWQPARGRVSGSTAAEQVEFAHYAQAARVIVAAPHPCDAPSFEIAARVAAQTGCPLLCLIRSGWRPDRRDRWVPLRHARDAPGLVPPGARVLVTLGRPALAELRALRHATAFVRQLSRHTAPCSLRHGRFLYDTPPFTLNSEIALMRRYRIDAVLTRNAGGEGGWPKIGAARALGCPVYMIARPKPSGGTIVHTVDAALNWLETRL